MRDYRRRWALAVGDHPTIPRRWAKPDYHAVRETELPVTDVSLRDVLALLLMARNGVVDLPGVGKGGAWRRWPPWGKPLKGLVLPAFYYDRAEATVSLRIRSYLWA